MNNNNKQILLQKKKELREALEDPSIKYGDILELCADIRLLEFEPKKKNRFSTPLTIILVLGVIAVCTMKILM